MPLTKVFAAGLWLVATIGSTAMVWAATSIVAADVTDRPAAVLARGDVVSELESGSSGAVTTTTGATAPAPTSTVPATGRGPAATTTTRALPPPAGTPVPQPGATIAPLPPPTTAPTLPPVARPAGPPTTQAPPRPTATYSTAGGVVGVACSGLLIELVSAIPTNGYAVSVVAGGPANVEVHFVRAGRDFSVKAVCFGQPIRYDGQFPMWPGPARP